MLACRWLSWTSVIALAAVFAAVVVADVGPTAVRPVAAADNPFADDDPVDDSAALRTWEDNSGRFKIEARLVRVQDGTVVLQRDGGKQIKVPLAKLSAKDREFLRQTSSPEPPANGDSLFGSDDGPAPENGNAAKSGGERSGGEKFGFGNLPGRGFPTSGFNDTPSDTPEVGITITDMSAARVIDISPTSQWRYTPDAAPNYAATAGGDQTTAAVADSATALKGKPKQKQISLGGPQDIFEDMSQLFVSADQTKAYAVTAHGTPREEERRSRVFACDLVAGKVDAVGIFAPGQTAMAMSPDSSLVAARTGISRSKFHNMMMPGEGAICSIFAVASKNAAPIVRWEPFQDNGEHSDRNVSWMHFVDNEHVLTAGMGGQMALWTVPALRPIWTNDIDDFSWRESVRPAMSPGGRVVALPADGGIAFIEVKTGDALGFLEADDIRGISSSLAISASGRRLALVEPGRCRVWTLDPPELIRDFVLPQRVFGGDSIWVDEDRLLVGGTHLVDTHLRIWLWDYENESSLFSIRGGRAWGVVGKWPLDNWTLVSATLPHPEALAIANSLDADDLLVVKPGVSMSVDVDLPLSAGARDAIRDAIVANVEKSGFTVDPNSEIKVTGGMKTGNAKEITYGQEDLFGRTQNVTTHTIKPETLMLTIQYQGQVIWRFANTKHAPMFLHPNEGESVGDALERKLETEPAILGRVRIPTHIPKGVAGQPYGSASGVPGRSAPQPDAR